MSKARAKLFALADLVRGSGDDTAVVLEQRGGGEGLRWCGKRDWATWRTP